MSVKAINLKLTGTTTPITSYDQTKINIGTLIKKYTGAGNTDKFIGPNIIGMARPMETAASIAVGFPYAVRVNDDLDWVFLSEVSAAAATRRIILYEYTRSTSTFLWKGFITLTYPTATTHTIRGFRVARNLYTTGTVEVNGTAVTGTSTAWQTDRLSVGTRIGFGSTDASTITTWYEISTIGGDGSITLATSAGTIPAGTSYVIDDIVIITQNTNATTTNGGLFIAKGIKPELFTPTGTVIAAATTIDNIRAVYWLADASTVTNTISCGAALDDRISWTDQRLYVPDSTGAKIYTYNIRKNLTLTAGKDTTSLVATTGIQALTGTISQANNGIIATLGHGPGSGVKSLYFVTTTRVYRAALSGITAASTTWQSDAMLEVPPGLAQTMAASSVLTTLDYAPDIDRLIVNTTNTRGYITNYNSTSLQFDHIYLLEDKQLDQAAADVKVYNKPGHQGLPFYIHYLNGLMYMVRGTTILANNQVYTLPIGAHKTYAINENQLLITPKFDVSDSNKLYNIAISNIKSLGTSPFELPLEPYDLYYRTSGISDNSGVWTALDSSGDLSALTGVTEIQFAIAFQTIGGHCIPARIMSLCLVYEDTTTDSHYEPSIAKSSIASNIFAYRQKTAWGSSIPDLRIRLTNAVTNVSIIDDSVTASAYGTWEYSTDGTIWNVWSSAADSVGNYIRYTAGSLPGSTKIRSLLTQV